MDNKVKFKLQIYNHSKTIGFSYELYKHANIHFDLIEIKMYCSCWKIMYIPDQYTVAA